MSVEPVVEVTRLEPGGERGRQRVEFSLRAQSEASGARQYVGGGQEVSVTFPDGYAAGTPLAVSVLLDHVPTDASPRSEVKVAGSSDGSARVWEVHDSSHVWTQKRVWLATNVDGPLTQKFLIV